LNEQENLGDIKDIANIMREALTEAVAKGENLSRNFAASKNELLDLNRLFDAVVSNSSEFADNILGGKDLQKEILKDARLFKKTQSEVIKLFDKVNKEAWAEQIKYLESALDLQGDQLESTEEYKRALQEALRFEEKNLTVIEKQFNLMEKQSKQRMLDELSLKNVIDTVEDLGAKIRNPNAAMASMFKTAGGLGPKMFEAAKGSKSIGETTGKLINPAMAKMKGLAAALFSPAGLLIVGVLGAAAALFVLYKLFKNYWDFLDKKVVPATAEFNKEIGGVGGNLGQLQSQAISTGVEFELLGKSFAEGAQLVRDFASGLRSVQIDKATLKTGKELVAILGLSGEEAGALSLQFQKQTGNLDGLNKMMSEGTREAGAYGIPVNDVLRDIGQAPAILARFGVANSLEFAKSSAKARSYGLTIKEITAAFGKQMDTFEGSSEAGNKLNAIFGTSINSFELMLETDPTKRMELFRKELTAQGKSWGLLSVFEKNVITQSLGVEESQAALILSSDEERKKLEAKANAKKKEIAINEKWNKGLQSIKTTLIAWSEELDNVMRSLTVLISTIFGWDSPAKNMQALADRIVNSMRNLSSWLTTTNDNWNKGYSSLDKYGKVLFVVAKGFSMLGDAIKFAFNSLKLMSTLSTAPFMFLVRFAGALVGGAGVIEALKMAGSATVEDVKAPIKGMAEAVGIAQPPAMAAVSTRSSVSERGPATMDFSKTKNPYTDIKVEVMDMVMDHKKIGEAVVKISRN
jgi:hypothetical protein